MTTTTECEGSGKTPIFMDAAVTIGQTWCPGCSAEIVDDEDMPADVSRVPSHIPRSKLHV